MSLDDEQRGFVEAHRLGRLATVDARGQPHVVPICFAVAGGVLYTPIDEKPKRVAAGALRRVRNILARPRVAVVFDRYDEDWRQLAWLQVRGTASLVEDAAERRTAIAALRRRYPQYEAVGLESRPIIKIIPAAVRWWSAAGP